MGTLTSLKAKARMLVCKNMESPNTIIHLQWDLLCHPDLAVQQRRAMN